MDLEMKMPDLATTNSDIKLIRWLVKPGQSVKRGQAVCEIETDKATSEVESITTGILKEVRALPEDLVSAGQVIAVFEVVTPPNSIHEVAPTLSLPTSNPTPPTRAKTLPIAAGLFARNRVVAAQRAVTKTDVAALSPAQRAVGRRMQTSKQTAPHFYLQASANAEPMLRMRKAAEPKKLVWDALFVCAVSNALNKFDRMCWRLEEDELVVSDSDTVGVAVDVQGNLYVVSIAAPRSKTPAQISDEIRAAVGRLEAGDLDARAVCPSRITITNLGGSNVESFAAIINPPEAAILAIGKVAPAVVVHEGNIVVQNRVSLTLSVDHRIVNGKYAADFLNAIVREFEAF
jgi:pyruvate dehydrogenase E2 component (dihydrolipoamide acetyltransferase)